MVVDVREFSGAEPCPKCRRHNLIFRSTNPAAFRAYPESDRANPENAPQVLCPDCGMTRRYSAMP